MKKILSGIRFWILLFFLLRIYGITQPPIEGAHSWRQSTGNMVARNFYETDNNILYPRVDMVGEKTGITGTEFPVLNYLVYLLSLPFGFHDWFGRLINLAVSSFGIFYFYKLLKLRFSEQVSFTAALLLLCSNWFMYSRKVMPDTFSVSLVIISLYYCFSYFNSGKLKHLLLYFLLVLAGVLSKIPAGFLLAVLIFPLLDKKNSTRPKTAVIAATGIALIPVGWWYFYWVPYLVKEFDYWHYYMGTTFVAGFFELGNDLNGTFERFYFDALKFSGCALFILGIILAFIKKEKSITCLFIVGLASFFVFMTKAGNAFSHHSYYILPFVPVMALVAAYAISLVKNHYLQIALTVVIVVESIANQQHDLRTKDSERYKLELEKIAGKVSERKTLIAINGGDSPQQLYLSHRKGWTVKDEDIARSSFLDSLKEKGCSILFINLKTYPQGVAVMRDEIFQDDYFRVVKL